MSYAIKGGRSALLALTVLACALAAAVLARSEPAGAAPEVTLSEPLRQWLATAASDARFNTIITFHDRNGFRQLDALGIPSRRLRQLPMAFARLTPGQVRHLSTSEQVRSLWHEQQMDLYLDESVPLTGADRVVAGDGLKSAYTGAGISVAVIDTGVDGLHPDLPAGAKTEGYASTGNPDVFDTGDYEPALLVAAPTGDTYGHGTHVASTIGGLGERFRGMAPGSRIYSFKTDAGAFLLGGWILASFDWILDYNANPANLQKIRVSSNSWGCCDGSDYRPDDPVNVATKALYDSGVIVVFAASNSGGPNTLNQYATSPWVVGVAAGTKNLALADFSSRGRFDSHNGTVDINWDRKKAQRRNSGVYRPSLTAPGEAIEAAKSSQATVMAAGTDPQNPLYTTASGTSMATPHVAGAVALMLEARPGLQPQHVIDILEGTATEMSAYELFEVGTGHLDALAAVRAAQKGKVRFPPVVTGKTPEFALAETAPLTGTAQPSTWLLRPEAGSCAQLEAAKNDPLFSFHSFTVAEGTDAIYTEIEWEDNKQLVYLVLYDPACNEAGVSAALLDIGDVNHRALLATAPAPGTWTVGIYGRVNLPTTYTGRFNTYHKR